MTLALSVTTWTEVSSEISSLAAALLVPKSRALLTLSRLLVIPSFEDLGSLYRCVFSLDGYAFALSFFVVGCRPVVARYGQLYFAEDLWSFQFVGLNI